MKITPRVAMELLTHEAIVRQAYKDSEGVWTWSVGITNASGHNVERYIGKPQPMKKCLEIYVWALRKYADDVLSEFSGYDLSEAQFAAALSFHYNTGGIRRASWVKHWKNGKTTKARQAFMAWRKPAAIIERRQAECDLFFDGTWSSGGEVTEYTRVTKNHTPVWGSAKRVNVSRELEALLSPQERPQEPPKASSGGKGALAAIIALGAAAWAAVTAYGCEWLGLFCG